MNPKQWQEIHELFEAALALPAEARAQFLAQACKGDREIEQRVAAMLAADERSNLPIDRPAHEAFKTFVPTIPQEEKSESFAGEMIGVYRLIKQLGHGGMGTVFLVYDTRLGRRAALKLLPSHLASHPEGVRRFQREARTASALNHPNIITIYDFGHESGRDYIVSEFVEGCTLRESVRRGNLTLSQILHIVVQAASALEAAHSAGIVHRDIKPENIMLRPDAYVKVLDFGLAKLSEPESGSDENYVDTLGKTSDFETRPGVLLGTVNYMSPEQARGHRVDNRSDLFSLGVILYELITGNQPFRGETWHHTLVAITDSEPQRISGVVEGVPEEFQKIISRALAKDRDDRYQTAGEMLTDLRTLEREISPDAAIQRIDTEASDNAPTIPRQMTGEIAPSALTTSEVPLDRVTGEISVLRWLTRKRLSLAGAIVLLVLLTGAAYLYFMRGLTVSRPALTEKDTVLLADFVNTTGDAVFDGPLKQGLVVQLEQSPYLNIFPEERARETLALMERSHDEKITREIGREICQRRGIKALLVGTIAPLGRNYVISLEAVNSQNGEAIAHQQTEAEGKEQVLKALGSAARDLREHLGESLASIRKFDAPIEQATTSSLEAFKDYTTGVELRRKGHYAQAVAPLKRAIDIDSQFAVAYEQLGATERDLRNISVGNEYLTRAFELRDRVSERERLTIAATYFRHITGELDKRLETSSRLIQTYPQDPYAFHLHGNSLMIAGDFTQAIQTYREALRLDPELALSRANLALGLMGLNRFDEAQKFIEEGIAQGQDSSGFRNRLYLIAFLKGDTASMQRHVDWYAGRAEEYQIRETQARALAFAGQRRRALETFEKAAALAAGRGLPAENARILANAANLNAIFGFTQLAEKEASAVLALLDKEGIGLEELQPSLIQQLDSSPLAWTLALCGEVKRAQILSDSIARKFPIDTMLHQVWLPLVRSTGELRQGSPADTDKAIQLLQPSRQYEAATFFKPVWTRGQLHIKGGNGSLAAAEFQKIIDQRGWDILSPLWPLAQLGLARAATLEGDTAKGRKIYEEFFRLWKDADADVPILNEAKREYAKLK